MVRSEIKLAFWAWATLTTATPLPVRLETRSDLTSHIANIHISKQEPVEGAVSFTYGSCESQSRDDAHHVIAEVDELNGSRLVWVIPRKAKTNGCISAWSESHALLGRSEPQMLHKVKRRAPQKRSSCTVSLLDCTHFNS